MKKRNEGISLISLIISIVVLLILATITVTVVTNEGIIKHAKEAKYSAEIANEKETIQKALMISKTLSETGTITAENLQKALDENVAIAVRNDDKILIQFIQSGRIYEVSENGVIEEKVSEKGEIEEDGTENGDTEESTIYVDTTPGVLAQNSNNEYMIESIEDLVALSAMANGGYSDEQVQYDALSRYTTYNFILMCDLDFKSSLSYNDSLTTKYNGYLGIEDKNVTLMEALTNIDKYKGFIPIGKSSSKLSIVFNGNDYQISNLYEKVETSAGLFGCIDGTGIIKNLKVTGDVTSTNSHAGGIIGSISGEIINCTNYATISGKYAGGVCGEALYKSKFNFCTNYGDVKSTEYSGGVVGYAYAPGGNLEFNYCINDGNILSLSAGGILGGKTSEAVIFNSCINSTNAKVEGNGMNGYAGGICGRKTNAATFYFYNCVNIGEVSGKDAGGILGRPSWWTGDILANCYSSGKVSGTNAGGLIGYAPGGDTGYNSYYLLSDSISKSIGSSSGKIDATALTNVSQEVINSLNSYIQKNEDEIDTTGWAKWILNNSSQPTLDFNQIWDGTEWETKE